MQLMFLATRTRPDILTAVCALATKCKEPRAADEVRLHRVIRYLADYKDLELHCKVTDLQLHAYFDAGWACHTDMKAESGHSFIYWSRASVYVLRRWPCPVLPPHWSVHGNTWQSSTASLLGQYFVHEDRHHVLLATPSSWIWSFNGWSSTLTVR